MKTITFILLSCYAFCTNAQTHFNQTMFLGGYGYNIKYTPPNNYVHDTMPNKIVAAFSVMGASSICDSNGNLLIISNGMNLFSGDASAFIEDGDSLASPAWYDLNQGFDRYSQTCLILPFMQRKFYYVQVSASDTQVYKMLNVNNDVRMDRLYYSVIDMNINGGQGKVIQRMKTLIDNKYLDRSCMQACRHANGKDWWVLKIGADSIAGNVAYKFLFTQDSVYDMGSQLLPAMFKYSGAWGQMQFNKDGNKWACSLDNNTAGEVFLADFDRCTGTLSNLNKINVLPETDTPPIYDGADSVNLGICFSPNGNLLYISRANHIVQYNLQNHSQYMVSGPDTAFQFAWYVKLNLGPDDKIYIGHAQGISKQLSTIDNPDIAGAGCNFCRKCIRSQSNRWLHSMADMPNYDLGELQPCWPVGIDGTLAEEENIIKVYPNPTSSILTIDYYLGEGQIGTFTMYDITGNEMISTGLSNTNSRVSINIQNFAKGIYLYKYIEDSRVRETGKINKE